MSNQSLVRSRGFPLAGALGVLFCAVAATGCTATLGAEPVYVSSEADITVVAAPPVNVVAYPREYYGGTTVYLVDGRWYRRSADRWVVYRREPVELGRRRVVIERSRNHPVRRDRDDHGYYR